MPDVARDESGLVGVMPSDRYHAILCSRIGGMGAAYRAPVNFRGAPSVGFGHTDLPRRSPRR